MDDRDYVLLTDRPLTSGADPLGFDGLADRLAGLVLSSRRSTPLTLGVLGGWGSGKSSLMGRLEDRLRAGDGVTTVWFNAWTAEGSSVLEGMIKSVLLEIGPGVLRRAMRHRKLLTGVRLMATLGLGFLGVGRMVDEIWERFSADATTRNELPKLVREAMEDWRRQWAARGDRLLVVFVDDLDRCSAANVVQVFEAVKLYLDAPGFVFVIGYDERMVARALDRERELEYREAARYLEKIVQIEYRMGRPDDAHARALVDALVERSRVAALLGDAERALIADSTQRNPRRVKRFLNSFVLARRLDPAAAEFPAEEFILLQLLQMSYPSFYDLLVGSTDRDAITEFYNYAQVYDWARRGQEMDDSQHLSAVFTGYGLMEPGPAAAPEDVLERLGRSVPEPILALVDDDDLRRLLSSFGGPAARAPMLERLRRLPPSVAVVESDAALDRRLPRGRSVLWIDDVPVNNLREIEKLKMDGIEVITARDLPEALRAWRQSGPFDVVISDVARADIKDAGFLDLASLRRDAGWDGPAIFYTSRITPDWRDRATALGAAITTSFDGVMAELEKAFAG